MTAQTQTNPLRIPGRFKLGLFGYLHEGGNCFTTVPERWPADWPSIVRMAQMADDAGLDFLLPISRWKGVPGSLMHRLHSFETLTHAAALGAITRRIAVLSTVHTPIIHPIVAAKAIVTVDHASGGRSGLNIVCGWNQDDFDMFGIKPLAHADRYGQAMEWFEIWSRLVAGAPEPFDFDGTWFKGLTGLCGLPGSVQQPRPIVISAAFSAEGRDYAVRTSDFLFTFLESFEAGRKDLADLQARAAASGRQEKLEAIAITYVVCRRTRAEATAFHSYYAEQNADEAGLDYYLAGRTKGASMPEFERQALRTRFAGGNGAYPLIGTPQDVADGLIEIQRAGFAGASVTILNFVDDLPLFVDEVLPILDRAGIRGGTDGN
ncbi:MAG: LLM class flavin-dependent oxidoreductase [Acetobacteraceae bacterium]